MLCASLWMSLSLSLSYDLSFHFYGIEPCNTIKKINKGSQSIPYKRYISLVLLDFTLTMQSPFMEGCLYDLCQYGESDDLMLDALCITLEASLCPLILLSLYLYLVITKQCIKLFKREGKVYPTNDTFPWFYLTLG